MIYWLLIGLITMTYVIVRKWNEKGELRVGDFAFGAIGTMLGPIALAIVIVKRLSESENTVVVSRKKEEKKSTNTTDTSSTSAAAVVAADPGPSSKKTDSPFDMEPFDGGSGIDGGAGGSCGGGCGGACGSG